jgi:hypothetical protein
MKLIEMKRRLECVPERDVHAAMTEFEAHLEALHLRQRFTVCNSQSARTALRESEKFGSEPRRMKSIKATPEP